jgi:ribose transport system ATP-binding protein
VLNRLEEGKSTPLLQVVQVNKKYGETSVLSDVDFALSEGSVHGVIGQNGAGKSTLVGVISGIVVPDSGQIYLSGESIEFGNPRFALSAGITTVYQELSLLSELCVFENMFLGDEIVKKHRLDIKAMIAQTANLLADLGDHGIDPISKTWRLSLAQRQIVEIARCVRRNTKVLILDEPSAVLGSDELSTLFELIKRLNARGTGVIYISHRLAEVEQISDRITVLRDGKVALLQDRPNFTRQKLINAMIGDDNSFQPHLRTKISGGAIFSVNGLKLHSDDPVGITFKLSPGEILGVAGHTGSGRSRLLKALVGLEKVVDGSVELDGKSYGANELKRLNQLGVRYLPEDRKTLGLFLGRSTCENMIVTDVKSLSNVGFLNARKIVEVAQKLYSKLGIRARGLGQTVARLSGGNQQKVLLARAMLSGPSILLLDEPLRGVDIGAKTEIIEAIKDHVAKGNFAIVVSSELADLISMTNRVLVMRAGAAHRLVNKPELDESELVFAMESS